MSKQILWAKRNPKKVKIIQQRYTQNLKLKIFHLLGDKCANPFNLPHPDWYNDLLCLQIDHIHGGGNKERKGQKRTSSKMFYLYVLKQIKVGSKDYQLLCANCNWIKRYENKETGNYLK